MYTSHKQVEKQDILIYGVPFACKSNAIRVMIYISKCLNNHYLVYFIILFLNLN